MLFGGKRCNVCLKNRFFGKNPVPSWELCGVPDQSLMPATIFKIWTASSKPIFLSPSVPASGLANLIHAGCHFQCNKQVCHVCVPILIQIADFVFGYDFRADAFIRQFV